MDSEPRHIAMLIDGDNAQPSLIERALAEAKKFGTVITRRVYGDWSTPQMSGWKEPLNLYAIQPIQQFRYTKGKNATDSALIIDAMDLLHGGTVGGFCIVSSDSDYTRLATRIREQGLFVMAVGRSNTPKPFVAACEVFVRVEDLLPIVQKKSPSAKSATADWTKAVTSAVKKAEREDGWAFLGAVGVHLRKSDQPVEPKNYGHKKLSSLIESRSDVFETRVSKSPSGATQVYARLKAP